MMEFRVLGPLEVVSGGAALQLGGARQRALLALLLLQRNRPVARERLIDQLWGEDPPPSAIKALHVYLSGLRKLVGDGRLETRSGGYLLRVEPGELDLERFEALAVEAGTVPAATARKLLTEALSLWRGEPLLDLGSSEFGRVEIARLEAERLDAIQERIEAELRLGLHRELIPELQRLAAAHPDRERLRG
jgi:DNA-binding SARP family transcriptional activator